MIQLLQNHSSRCGLTGVQSPFVASYKARFECIKTFLLLLFVSGRFDEAVIEERRKAAEAMFLFTTNIPALYNSPHLKEFLRVRNTDMLTEEMHANTNACLHLKEEVLPSSSFLSLPVVKCHVWFLSNVRVVRPPGLWIQHV